MKTWKRIAAFALLIACAVILTGCGNSGEKQETTAQPAPATEAPAPVTEEPVPSEEPAPATEEPVPSEEPTPPDEPAEAEAPFIPKSMRFVAAPAEAVGEDDPGAGVIAVGEGGNKLLILGKYSLYLWDVSAGQRMPVYFTGEDDIARFEERAAVMMREKSSDEEIEKQRSRIQAWCAEHGAEHLTSFDQLSEISGGALKEPLKADYIEFGEHFALVTLYNQDLYFAVNLSTGEARMAQYSGTKQKAGENQPWLGQYGLYMSPKLYGDILLSDSGITDLATGETVRPALVLPKNVPADIMPSVLSALQLRNGRILATIEGFVDRETKTRNWYLFSCETSEGSQNLLSSLLNTAAGNSTCIKLGAFSSMSSPSSLCVTGDERYAAVSSPSDPKTSIAVVSLETGEIRLIAEEKQHLFLLGAYGTGFICFDANTYEMTCLDAETLSRTALDITAEGGPEIALNPMVYLNARGRYWCFCRARIPGYFLAEE